MTLVGGFQSLTNTTKNFTLDFAWILNTPLISDKLLINLKIPSHASTVPVNIHPKDLFIATQPSFISCF